MKSCPKASSCGGCSFCGVRYCDELRDKQDFVASLLGRYAPVAPIIGMENPYYYRNKVQSVFGRNKKGETVNGIYREGTHRIIPVFDCLLEDKEADAVLKTVSSVVRKRAIVPYDEDEGTGLVRHVLIRRAVATNQSMVVLVCSSYKVPGIDFIAHEIMTSHPSVKTVLVNRNREKTSMVLSSEPCRIVCGDGFITDELCGLKFRISASSFYQVNPYQARLLYTVAMRMARLSGHERVIDAYCGTGTIGLIASSYGAGSVVGIELNTDACKDACENARINGIPNVEILNGDASVILKQMTHDKQSADVVFLDPPRSGSDERFLSSVIKLSPRSVVYISCNPETLARDIRYLTRFGNYHVVGIQPVDMFPRTKHSEIVTLLTRNN